MESKMTFEETFCMIMEQDELPDNFDKLEIGEITEWDSLANMLFLMELEKNFSIRFSMDEMSELTSIKSIQGKLAELVKN
jgi:acyl carrier protein